MNQGRRGWGLRSAGVCVVALATLGSVACTPAADTSRRPVDALDCARLSGNVNTMFGPTDIAATSGNGRLSVGVNERGTVTTMRWPSPSFYDHVKHLTIGRDQPLLGALENEGVFSGIRLERDDGSVEFAWLRDLDRVDQRFASDRTDTVVTTFRHAPSGVEVAVHDTVDADLDAFVRRHVVTAPAAAEVVRIRLVAFSNLQVTHEKYSGLPVWDTCLDQLHDAPAHYDPAADAVVSASAGTDPSTGRPSSSAAALGWADGNDDHDVAHDTLASPLRALAHLAPPDAYAAASAGAGELAGRTAASDQVDAAVARDLELGADGRAEGTFITAFGATGDEAVAALASSRATHDGTADRKASWWEDWLGPARLPATTDPDVLRHAQRALIVLRQAHDAERGGVVASISTQPPYNMAWVRDDLYFAEAMKAAGHPDAAEAINRFHARTLVRADQRPPGAAATPIGNWPMTLYLDGTTGGPIPYEIDETGLGLAGLVIHWEDTGDLGYLRDVYPSIVAAADFLTGHRNPLTGLPLPSWEDDNPIPVLDPTPVSSASVLAGLQHAERAAVALGDTGRAARWGARAAELRAAVERSYVSSVDPDAYGTGNGYDYLLWPAELHPPDHPRMQAQADLLVDAVDEVFDLPDPTTTRTRGQYQAKALFAAGKVWSVTSPGRLGELHRGLRWLATVPVTEGTGISGETWFVEPDGSIRTGVAQPHVWNMTLFYLASLLAYP